MKKSIVLLGILLLLSVVLVAPVSAQERVFSGRGASAESIVTPPYHPKILVEAINFELSTFGPLDLLMISVWMESPEFTEFAPWVTVTDDPKCAALIEEMFAGVPYFRVVLVGERDLDVWVLFRRVTAILRAAVGTRVIHPFTMKVRCHGWGE